MSVSRKRQFLSATHVILYSLIILVVVYCLGHLKQNLAETPIITLNVVSPCVENTAKIAENNECVEDTRSLKLLVADNFYSRQRGLSKQPELFDVDGMVFQYASPQDVTFVMRDMSFDIDFAFVREDGVISKVVRNVEASFEGEIKSDEPVTAVIEVPSSKQLLKHVCVGSKLDL